MINFAFLITHTEWITKGNCTNDVGSQNLRFDNAHTEGDGTNILMILLSQLMTVTK